MKKKQQFKQTRLNGFDGYNGFKGGYWYPRHFPSTSKFGTPFVWPDGKEAKTWLSEDEQYADYRKRYDELMANPWGPGVLELYRQYAEKRRRRMSAKSSTPDMYRYAALFEYDWIHYSGIPEYIKKQKAILEEKNKKAEVQQKKAAVQTKLVLKKKQETQNNIVKIALISAGSLAAIGIGAFFILKE